MIGANQGDTSTSGRRARSPWFIEANSRRRSLKRPFCFFATFAYGDALRRNILVAITCSLAFQLVVAQEYKLKSLRIDHPFARATPPGARSAGAYFGVENDGSTPDRLVSASSPVASIVEMHEMTMDGGVMKMGAIAGIEIKARARVELKPGGYHFMLMDLKRPLKEGERFPMTLLFEKAGTIEVSVLVEDMGATMGDAQKH